MSWSFICKNINLKYRENQFCFKLCTIFHFYQRFWLFIIHFLKIAYFHLITIGIFHFRLILINMYSMKFIYPFQLKLEVHGQNEQSESELYHGLDWSITISSFHENCGGFSSYFELLESTIIDGCKWFLYLLFHILRHVVFPFQNPQSAI